jgi:hypothetical protein
LPGVKAAGGRGGPGPSVASETVAGRVAFVYLSGFDLTEVGAEASRALWFRGGFPRSFFAGSEDASYAWRQDFIDTFLTRDAARPGVALPPEQLRCLWICWPIFTGGTCPSSVGGPPSTTKTAGRYVDILVGAYLVRRLPPWFENTGKPLERKRGQEDDRGSAPPRPSPGDPVAPTYCHLL